MTQSRILACYSSQSGTSESLAERLCNNINKITKIENFCEVLNISKFEVEIKNNLKEIDLIIFFISSYGEGEPCDDGINFFQNLNNYKNDFSLLKNYSIFGCGNSFYDKYQAVSIKLKEYLDLLNINQIGEFGMSNEANNNVIDDFDSWEFDYLPVLSKNLKFKLIEISTYQPKYEFINVYKYNENTILLKPPYQELKPFITNINLNSIQKYGSRYIHFNINLHKDSSKIKYQIGDHVGVYPKNDSKDVNEIIQLLDIKDDLPFKIISMNRMESNRWINKTFKSYNDFLTNEIEINGVLSRKLIKDIIKYFIRESSIEIRNKLNELIKTKEVFNEHVINKKLTLVKLFKKIGIEKGIDYDSIPISFIIENFGLLKPRLFSISSSNMVENDSISVLIKLVKDNTNEFEGICSNTIEKIISGELQNSIPIFINKSKFKLPIDLSRPMIFVGAGSGIAPFRGFLQEICSQPNKIEKITKIIVYFGIHELNNEYFIYKESFETFSKILGEKLILRMAISTGFDGNKYVQDCIREDCDTITKILVDNNGHIFVCGDAGGMSRGVKKTLVDVIGESCGDVKSGDRYVQYLQSMGRYREDVW